MISNNYVFIGELCPALLAPLNGRVLDGGCEDKRTGDICRFGCDSGYTLRGSRDRICSPSNTWTGSMPVCEPRQCERLEAPDNGALLPPCNRDFMSSCLILCNFGFERQGPERQTCVLRGSNELEWSEAPECIGKNCCFCLHTTTIR